MIYLEIEKKTRKIYSGVMEQKDYFEKNSFEGSQYWKWMEEFRELMDDLEEIRELLISDNYTEHSEHIEFLREKIIEEAADEVLTRIQWDMPEALKVDAIKKMKLENVYHLYEHILSIGNIDEAIEEKFERTKNRIKTGFYKQYS